MKLDILNLKFREKVRRPRITMSALKRKINYDSSYEVSKLNMISLMRQCGIGLGIANKSMEQNDMLRNTHAYVILVGTGCSINERRKTKLGYSDHIQQNLQID